MNTSTGHTHAPVERVGVANGGIVRHDGAWRNLARVDTLLGELVVALEGGGQAQALGPVAGEAAPFVEAPCAAAVKVADTLVAVVVDGTGRAAAFGLECATAGGLQGCKQSEPRQRTAKEQHACMLACVVPHLL